MAMPHCREELHSPENDRRFTRTICRTAASAALKCVAPLGSGNSCNAREKMLLRKVETQIQAMSIAHQDNQRCPNCGGVLPAGALDGLCPRCLLAASDSADGTKPS